MRSFEECLKAARWETLKRNVRYGIKSTDRKRARQRRKVLREVALLLASLVVLANGIRTAMEDKPAAAPELPVVATDAEPVCMVLPEVEEPQEAAPLLIYYDVPLSRELQDLLRAACEESGVPMELALAVVWEETDFRNLTGDDGESEGYMQVQEKWHRDRMERLGAEDLMDPAGNFRVGCDFLAELLDKHPLAYALTCYNSGDVRVSEYSERVMDYQEALKNKKAAGPWWEPTA